MVKATWKNVDGEESELTDLSEDEDDELEEPEPSPPPAPKRPPPKASSTQDAPLRKSSRSATQKATEQSKARSNHPVPALPPPRTTTYSAYALYEMIKDEDIDLNPEYQRDVVWNDAKQSSLINSLFHNYHIPQILLAVVEDDEYPGQKYVCIDGKQRLTSLHRFFDGLIPMRPNANNSDPSVPGNKKEYFKKIPGSRGRKELPESIKKMLKTKQIACVVYSNLRPEHERDMFQRVQWGVSLNPADRLPASNGDWADVVRRLRRRIDTTVGFEGYLEWGKARGKDFQALAQIVYLAVYGNSRKSDPTPARIESFLDGDADRDYKPIERDLTSTMDIFCRLASSDQWGETLRDDLTPRDFVLAGYLIFVYRTRLSDGQLDAAIKHTRVQSKKESDKVKGQKGGSNLQIKALVPYINKNIGQLAANGKFTRAEETDTRPAASVPYVRRETSVDPYKYRLASEEKPDVREAGPSGTSKTTTGKRKRKDEDVDGNESDAIPLSTVVRKSKAKKPVSSVSAPTSKLAPKAGTGKAKTTIRKTPGPTSSSAPVKASTTKKPTLPLPSAKQETTASSSKPGKHTMAPQIARKTSAFTTSRSPSSSRSASMVPAPKAWEPASNVSGSSALPPPPVSAPSAPSYTLKAPLPGRPKSIAHGNPIPGTLPLTMVTPGTGSVDGGYFAHRRGDSHSSVLDPNQARMNLRNIVTTPAQPQFPTTKGQSTASSSSSDSAHGVTPAGASSLYSNMRFTRRCNQDSDQPSPQDAETARSQPQPAPESQHWHAGFRSIIPQVTEAPIANSSRSSSMRPGSAGGAGAEGAPRRSSSGMITPNHTPSPNPPNFQPNFVQQHQHLAGPGVPVGPPREPRAHRTQDPRRRSSLEPGRALDADSAAHAAAEHIKNMNTSQGHL